MQVNKSVRRTIMATEPIKEYMLLFRGTHWFKGLSPEEIQQIVDQMHAWLDRLTAEGKAKAGQPLMFEGKVVSQKNGRVVSDGPFAESKEAIAGYFLLNVDSLDEAVQIAKNYPGLNYGATVEVRPVAPECAASLALLERLEEEEVSQTDAPQFT
jgi:hypothetical protein